MNIGRLRKSIEERLQSVTDPEEAARVAIDETLSHLLSFVQELSAELTMANLHSEALVAGLIHLQLKRLKKDIIE